MLGIIKDTNKFALQYGLSQKILYTVRNFQSNRPIILGIESSCDDTGCGIVDSKGNVLGEAINHQLITHLRYGGIMPPIAYHMHKQHITKVCEDALSAANLKLRDVDAIAATVKPGLLLSLKVGKTFGQYLCNVGNKPFIPIHHMEAHALTVRMTEKVEFPYVVLLISGGHCLLAVVDTVNKFYLLGTATDNAPGEVLDKLARRFKLHNIPEFYHLNGGAAIEKAAERASNPSQFTIPAPMTQNKSCDFSFAGILNSSMRLLLEEEQKHAIKADMTVPDIFNLCAAVQMSTIMHICRSVQRAIEFLDTIKFIPPDKRSLVISGGVASNNLIAKALGIVCSKLDYKFVRTPPKYCCDNGVMIAWNGMEKWLANTDIITNRNEIEQLNIQNKAPFGVDWRGKVTETNLKCDWIKIKKELS